MIEPEAIAGVQFTAWAIAVCLLASVLCLLEMPRQLTILYVAYLAKAGGASRFGWETHVWHLDEARCRGCVAGCFESSEADVGTETDSASRAVGPGQGTEPKPILLVESVFQSAVLMSRIFRELNLLDQLAISMDCETALVRLRQADIAKPRLILLDSRMPRMSAASFLEVVKSDPRLQMIPIVVLSDADGAEGVNRYYELGAAGYMVHDGEYTDVFDKMRALCNYWMLSRSPAIY